MSAALGRDRTCEEFVPDPDPEPKFGARCLRCGAFEEQHGKQRSASNEQDHATRRGEGAPVGG